MNVAEPVLHVLESAAERVAIVEPTGRSVSFLGMRRRVVGLAVHLQRIGMEPGDRALLQVPIGIEGTAAALAVLLVGGVPVLSEPGFGDSVYLSRVRASDARWILVHPMLEAIHVTPAARSLLRRRGVHVPPVPSSTESLRKVRVWRRSLDLLALRHGGTPNFRAVARHSEDDGILVFTGGTTSSPKGVRLPHRALDHYVHNISSVLSGVTLGSFAAETPQQVLYAMRLGQTTFVTRGSAQKRARQVLSLIRDRRVEMTFSSPHLWLEMMALDDPSSNPLPQSLKTVLLGSAPVTPQFLQRLVDWVHPDTHVLSMYGLTEVGPVCSIDVATKLGWVGEGDLVGAALEGIEITLEDRADGGPGEVVVRSASLYAGYLEQPPREAHEGLKTGDLGAWVDVNGQAMLTLMGRIKDMIIRRGVNIYPGTLEPTVRGLKTSSGRRMVADCALIGLWDSVAQDERVVLCVQQSTGVALDVDELRRDVERAVGIEGSPDHILPIDRFPRVGRQSKVDKRALRMHAADLLGLAPEPPGSARSAQDSPAKEVSADLAGDALWQRLPGPLVPFDWHAFALKYRLMFEREPKGAVALQAAVRLALFGVAQVGWGLDDVVSPGWRGAEPGGVLFILGHQRSGTTLLHRLLARDETRFRALKLHEMLLPASSFQAACQQIGAWDERWGGGRLRHAFDQAQNRLFGSMDAIHRIRFDEVEEDEFALWAIFASAMCANDAPSAAEHRGLDTLRNFHSWPEHRQARSLGWYRACLLKKLHREPGPCPADPPWIVSKNPAFSHKVKELRKRFPEARFVYLVRNPLEAIPSRVRMIREIWRRRFPSFSTMSESQVETILADSFRTYLAADRDLLPLDDKVRKTVLYDDLVADPRKVTSAIYEHFELGPPGPRLREHLDRLATKGPREHYGRENLFTELGLSEARIRRELHPVFERYRFE